jgi:hypothetical protein
MTTLLIVLGSVAGVAAVWWLIICSARCATLFFAAVLLFAGCMAVGDGAFLDGLLLFVEAAFLGWLATSLTPFDPATETPEDAREVAP